MFFPNEDFWKELQNMKCGLVIDFSMVSVQMKKCFESSAFSLLFILHASTMT